MKISKKVFISSLLILSTMLIYAVGGNVFKDDSPALEPFISSGIALKGEAEINLIVGDDYIDAGVTVSDDIHVIDIIKTGKVDTFSPGKYIISYAVIDDDEKRTEIERIVVVKPLEALLPDDTNLYYAPKNENTYLYFADPQPSEHGKNRVIRIDYDLMEFDEDRDSVELTEDAYLLSEESHSNPHSIDRAGKTNKFYVRTQNAYSFDVVAVENHKLKYIKTVPLFVDIDGTEVKYSPRALGSYNAKYDIQLVSGKNSSNYTIVGIIDVKTDEVVKHVYKPISGSGSSTSGHAKWLNADHFAVIDRGNNSIDVYKVFINEEEEIDAKNTGSIDIGAPAHAINRVKNPKNILDLNTFYIMGESFEDNGTKTPPFVQKLVFDADTGKFDPAQSCNRETSCDSESTCDSGSSCNGAESCAAAKSCDSGATCNSGTSCSAANSCSTTTSCASAKSCDGEASCASVNSCNTASSCDGTNSCKTHASQIALFLDTDYAKLKEKKIPATTHHINTTLDGRHLVVPVYDGKIYKVDRVTMRIVKTIDTGVEKGLGAAHIEFSNSLGLAVVTNHWSPYITILDVSNNEFKLKGYVKIYREGQYDVHNPNEKHLMQPHFAQMSEDGKYFYTFASQDNGRFVRVNLEEALKLEVDDENVFVFDNDSDDSDVLKSIDVEGAPEQAHS